MSGVEGEPEAIGERPVSSGSRLSRKEDEATQQASQVLLPSCAYRIYTEFIVLTPKKSP